MRTVAGLADCLVCWRLSEVSRLGDERVAAMETGWFAGNNGGWWLSARLG